MEPSLRSFPRRARRKPRRRRTRSGRSSSQRSCRALRHRRCRRRPTFHRRVPRQVPRERRRRLQARHRPHPRAIDRRRANVLRRRRRRCRPRAQRRCGNARPRRPQRYRPRRVRRRRFPAHDLSVRCPQHRPSASFVAISRRSSAVMKSGRTRRSADYRAIAASRSPKNRSSIETHGLRAYGRRRAKTAARRLRSKLRLPKARISQPFTSFKMLRVS